MTVTNPKGRRKRAGDFGRPFLGGDGVNGYGGAKFEGKELTIDGCGGCGVVAWYTQGTLTDCIVTNCGRCGIVSSENGVIHLYGERTQVTRNCTNWDSNDYGLNAYYSSSQIILHAPLTKRSVSRNNGRGNWGGSGKIIERR